MIAGLSETWPLMRLRPIMMSLRIVKGASGRYSKFECSTKKDPGENCMHDIDIVTEPVKGVPRKRDIISPALRFI